MSDWFRTTTLLDEVDSTNSFVQRTLADEDSMIELPWLVVAKTRLQDEDATGTDGLVIKSR